MHFVNGLIKPLDTACLKTHKMILYIFYYFILTIPGDTTINRHGGGHLTCYGASGESLTSILHRFCYIKIHSSFSFTNICPTVALCLNPSFTGGDVYQVSRKPQNPGNRACKSRARKRGSWEQEVHILLC